MYNDDTFNLGVVLLFQENWHLLYLRVYADLSLIVSMHYQVCRPFYFGETFAIPTHMRYVVTVLTYHVLMAYVEAYDCNDNIACARFCCAVENEMPASQPHYTLDRFCS